MKNKEPLQTVELNRSHLGQIHLALGQRITWLNQLKRKDIKELNEQSLAITERNLTEARSAQRRIGKVLWA